MVKSVHFSPQIGYTYVVNYERVEPNMRNIILANSQRKLYLTEKIKKSTNDSSALKYYRMLVREHFVYKSV